MLVIPAKKFGRIYLSLQLPIWRDIWSKTWPIAVSIALNLLYLKTDVIILSVTRPPEEVGLYGAAYKVIEVLSTFPILFAGILLPLLSRYWQTQEKKQFGKLVQEGFDAMSILAWPIIVGTLFVGGDVMALVAGEEFRESGLILQLLIWASGIIFFNAIFAHAIVALNKQKQTIWAYGITALVGIIGYLYFIPKYGPIGAAAMTVVTEGMVALLVFVMYIRFSSIMPSLRRWGSAILSSLIMAGGLWLLKDVHYLIQIVSAMGIYGIAIILTGGVSKEFLRDILTLRRYEV
jgi:O-antigen/teichoic acid export membrane protein